MNTSSIQDEIHRATLLFDAQGAEVLGESDFQKYIADYVAAIRCTQQLMIDSGIVALCGACAAQSRGSCCGEGVEDWYDHWLLFINLLMGARIDLPRKYRGQCLFVGSKGCTLIARHSFCVNFLCSTITQSLGESQTKHLRSVNGAELHAGWVLEQELRSWVNSRDTALRNPSYGG